MPAVRSAGGMGKLVCPCRAAPHHGQAVACPCHPSAAPRFLRV